jgi:hypothetical protein
MRVASSITFAIAMLASGVASAQERAEPMRLDHSDPLSARRELTGPREENPVFETLRVDWRYEDSTLLPAIDPRQVAMQAELARNSPWPQSGITVAGFVVGLGGVAVTLTHMAVTRQEETSCFLVDCTSTYDIRDHIEWYGPVWGVAAAALVTGIVSAIVIAVERWTRRAEILARYRSPTPRSRDRRSARERAAE